MPKAVRRIDQDSKEQLHSCIRTLLQPSKLQKEVLSNKCKNQFSTMIKSKNKKSGEQTISKDVN